LAEARVARYWDDLVTGASERVDADIDPTLVQTIGWLERTDDAQPASAEFSRRFESQFLQSVDTTSPRLQRPAAERVISAHPDRHQGNHRGLPLPDEKSSHRHRAVGHDWGGRILISAAAVLVLVVALAAMYYELEHREGSRNSNVILAPSSSIDVPMDRGDAARSGVMPGPSVANGLESIWHVEAGRSGVSAPAVVGDTVFVTSGAEIGSGPGDRGAIIAVDAQTGSERWRFPVEHAAGDTPAVAGGIVYAGDTGGIVYALDAETGKELWRQDLQSGWTSAPVVVDDTVYVAVAPYRASLHVAVQDGTVVVGSGLAGQPGDGIELYALDRTSGDIQWESGGDRLRQPGLFAFDADDGMLAWQFDMPSLESGPAISGQHVYAGSSLDGNFYALDLASGAEAWIAPIGEDLPSDSSPAISGGSLFITTAFGQVICLDSSSGAERWRAEVEHNSLNSSAIVIGSVVYVVDTSWGLSALSTTDGSMLWSEQLDLNGQVAVSPVIVNATLYIGTSLESDSAYAATLWAFSASSDTSREAP
jgi:outer membrane protein assembly factor BamB